MASLRLLFLAHVACVLGETYVQVATVNLSSAGTIGAHGDWVAYDDDTGTVWLSHSPDSNVVVLNADTNDVRVVIPNVVYGNGITFSCDFAFVADNDNNTVNVYNKFNYRLVQQLSTPGGPDGVYWDDQTQAIWVTLDSTSQLLKFQRYPYSRVPFGANPAATISLNTTTSPSNGPDVGTYVADFSAIYQPIDNSINVIDVLQDKVTKVWTLNFTGSLKGVSYDPVRRNIIAGTSIGRAYILSASTGQVVSTIPLPGAVDQSVTVPAARRAYFGDKAGFIDVIDLDHGTLLQNVTSSPLAHTLTAFQANFNQIKVFSYFDQNNLVGVYLSNRGS